MRLLAFVSYHIRAHASSKGRSGATQGIPHVIPSPECLGYFATSHVRRRVCRSDDFTLHFACSHARVNTVNSPLETYFASLFPRYTP